MKKWDELSLKWRMITLLVSCWLVPILLASIIVSFVVTRRVNAQMTENVIASTEKVAQGIEAQLENVRKASRNATYFNVIKDSYSEYKEDKDTQKLYDEISIYLAQQYRYDPALNSAILFFTEEPELFYYTYNAGTAYDHVEIFRRSYLKEALEISETLDTKLMLCTFGDSVYLMRNLVNSSYKPEALLILELNTDYVFNGLNTIWGHGKSEVYLNGELIYGDGERTCEGISFLNDEAKFIKEGNEYYAVYHSEADKGDLSYIVTLDSKIVNAQTQLGIYILGILVASFVPLGIAVFVFFDRSVSRPLRGLVHAAGEISKENYGYEIEAEGYSKEFLYVNKAFNEMSKKLKTQFEQIYLEELAVRDANIKALQSQINPHFINNTLEIINWEARLNGVYKVSAMIEALSTMLNATLNRKNDHSIPLSEELEYVDAYLYVIKERMGSRLTIHKEVDEKLLSEKVPRLIAQPIIENAVEHGIKTTSNGYIKIKVYARNENMFFEIRNSGNMTKEDEDKINNILYGDEKEAAKHSVSIGINNVNKRLKLMYGDDCGLTISNDKDETVNLLSFKREVSNG